MLVWYKYVNNQQNIFWWQGYFRATPITSLHQQWRSNKKSTKVGCFFFVLFFSCCCLFVCFLQERRSGVIDLQPWVCCPPSCAALMPSPCSTISGWAKTLFIMAPMPRRLKSCTFWVLLKTRISLCPLPSFESSYSVIQCRVSTHTKCRAALAFHRHVHTCTKQSIFTIVELVNIHRKQEFIEKYPQNTAKVA